jgi:cytochrome P450 family 628
MNTVDDRVLSYWPLKALRDYECRVLSHSLELLAQFSATAGKAVNASAWFKYFSFDVMGDLAFGKSFDMVKNGTPHVVLKRMHGSMALAALFGNIPWFTHIFLCLPIVRSETIKWLKWCEEQVEERKKVLGLYDWTFWSQCSRSDAPFTQMTRDRPDIFSHLIDDDVRKAKDPVVDLATLTRDSNLVVVAGSDTVAATLANTFYRLSKHPDKLQLLQKEIDPLFTSEADFNYKLVSDLPILDGVINEVLRLHSPSPSGVQRVTPKEGVTIAGTYIPGDTIVSIPLHILQRGASPPHEPTLLTPPLTYHEQRPKILRKARGIPPRAMVLHARTKPPERRLRPVPHW